MSTVRAPLGSAPLERAQRASRRDWLPSVVLAAILVGSVVALMAIGRDTTFFYDDWDFVTQRRDWNLYVLLHPHNEHLSVVSVFVYKLLFETVGIDQYGPYRFLLAALNALVGLLLYLYAAPRAGRWPALGLVAALLFLGPAWQDLLWAFQIGFLISIACALGVLLCLDRGSRRADVLACALLCVAIGSSSIGIPLLVGVAVEVLLRPDRRSRVWIVLVPLVLYAGWYLKYGVSVAKASNADAVPEWIVDAAAGAAGALTALDDTLGLVLVAVLAVFAVRAVVAERLPPRLLALLALPLSFWAATALARADMGVLPDESRYLYPGALFLVLIALELVRGRTLPVVAAVLVTVGLGAAAVANRDELEAGGDGLRGQAASARGSTTALELLGGDDVPPTVEIDPVQVQIDAGPYLAAVADYGSSPAWKADEIPKAPAADRANVDAALVRLGGIGVTRGGAVATDEPAPVVAARSAARVAATGSCQRVSPSGSGSQVLLVPHDGEIAIAAGREKVGVHIVRFGDTVREEGIGEVAPGTTSVVEIKPDTAKTPWRIALRSTAPFRGCGAQD